MALALPTTTVNNNTVINNTIINLYTYTQTPLPPQKKVMKLLEDPPNALPAYFGLKHCTDAKTRNVKIVDAKDGKLFTWGRAEDGVKKWKVGERKRCLKKLVGSLVDDLTSHYKSPHLKAWQGWREWGKNEGLIGFSEPEERDAYRKAEDQIEQRLIEMAPGAA